MGLFSKCLEIIQKRESQKKQIDLMVNKNEYPVSVKKTTIVKKPRKLPINIGIDFGTSYSKVCYEQMREANFVMFNKSEYKPSVLYYNYDKKIIYYNKPSDGTDIEKIKYFKYSMINDSLPKSEHLSIEKLSVQPEILCSVFFLSCLVKMAKVISHRLLIAKSLAQRIEDIPDIKSFPWHFESINNKKSDYEIKNNLEKTMIEKYGEIL
jgi:hypothetical protein